MALTSDQFRRLALSLPDATERAHMDHPDFRVRGKILATLGYPGDDWGMIKLTTEQQREVVRAKPGMFAPVKGGWGRQGATSVCLTAADEAAVSEALGIAWRNLVMKPARARRRAARRQT